MIHMTKVPVRRKMASLKNSCSKSGLHRKKMANIPWCPRMCFICSYKTLLKSNYRQNIKNNIQNQIFDLYIYLFVTRIINISIYVKMHATGNAINNYLICNSRNVYDKSQSINNVSLTTQGCLLIVTVKISIRR